MVDDEGHSQIEIAGGNPPPAPPCKGGEKDWVPHEIGCLTPLWGLRILLGAPAPLGLGD